MSGTFFATHKSENAATSGIRIKVLDDICSLIENFKILHSKVSTSLEKVTRFEEHFFIQMKHLDDSLKIEGEDIYLVHGQQNAFIVQLNSENSHDQLTKAQSFLESVWKVRLPVYCGSKLICCREMENIECISKLQYLLHPKCSVSKAKSSGTVSVSAEETDQFTKNGKLFLLFRVLIQYFMLDSADQCDTLHSLAPDGHLLHDKCLAKHG